MARPTLIVKYLWRNILRTHDPAAIFEVLFRACGDGIRVAFEQMTEEEMEATGEYDGKFRVHRQTMFIFEETGPAEVCRRVDLEQALTAFYKEHGGVPFIMDGGGPTSWPRPPGPATLGR